MKNTENNKNTLLWGRLERGMYCAIGKIILQDKTTRIWNLYQSYSECACTDANLMGSYSTLRAAKAAGATLLDASTVSAAKQALIAAKDAWVGDGDNTIGLAVRQWANSTEGDVDADGDVWICDPMQGHWLDEDELGRLAEWMIACGMIHGQDV